MDPKASLGLKAFVTILGLAGAAGVVLPAVIVSIQTDGWPRAIFLLGALVVLGWLTFALIVGFDSPDANLGGFATLVGFLIGSLLALFSKASDIPNKMADLSSWQASCWLVAALFLVYGLENTRRRGRALPKAVV